MYIIIAITEEKMKPLSMHIHKIRGTVYFSIDVSMISQCKDVRAYTYPSPMQRTLSAVAIYAQQNLPHIQGCSLAWLPELSVAVCAITSLSLFADAKLALKCINTYAWKCSEIITSGTTHIGVKSCHFQSCSVSYTIYDYSNPCCAHARRGLINIAKIRQIQQTRVGSLPLTNYIVIRMQTAQHEAHALI